jgi:hypothetical protein
MEQTVLPEFLPNNLGIFGHKFGGTLSGLMPPRRPVTQNANCKEHFTAINAAIFMPASMHISVKLQSNPRCSI